MNKCDICGVKSNYEGVVAYHSDYTEYWLCRKHHMSWLHSKELRNSNKKYMGAKPATRKWYAMCKDNAKSFDKWFSAQKSTRKLGVSVAKARAK